jgi:hypothetical protein
MPAATLEKTQAEGSDWRRGARVCFAWLFGSSILVSVTMSLQTGEVFQAFRIEAGIGGSVVALAFVRVFAFRLSAMAVWLGVCSYVRHRARAPSRVFLAVPALYPVPIVVGLPLSSVVLRHEVAAGHSEFWSDVLRRLAPGDFAFGVTQALASSLCLAGLAVVLFPFLDAKAPKRVPRALLSWLAGGCAIGVVGSVSNLLVTIF